MIQGSHNPAIRPMPQVGAAAERHDDRAEIVVDGIDRWRTRQRRPLFALLFRLPVFRRWPTTYRWQATLEFTDDPTFSSRWTRQSKQHP